MHRAVTAFVLVCLTGLSGCSAEGIHARPDAAGADPIAVRVDPAVELVSTIYRLADVPTFTTRLLPSYVGDIEEHFAPFRDHPAIGVVSDLRRTGHIDGSAPMALAVYLRAPDLDAKVPIPPLPTDLDPRWTSESVARFRDAVRAFASDTRFMEFYDDRTDYYDRSVENLRSALKDHPIIAWLEETFARESENYIVLIGMQIGSGNYGLSTTLEDGSREFISVIGATSPSVFRKVPTFSHWWFIPTVVHEFAHSFVNPVVDANESLLRDVAERLYPYHREKLWPQGYRSWRTLSYEYVVRATVIRYLEDHGDREGVRRRIQADENQGFPGITLLAEAFAEYEANRRLYPTFDAFVPRLVTCFEEILRDVGS